MVTRVPGFGSASTASHPIGYPVTNFEAGEQQLLYCLYPLLYTHTHKPAVPWYHHEEINMYVSLHASLTIPLVVFYVCGVWGVGSQHTRRACTQQQINTVPAK